MTTLDASQAVNNEELDLEKKDNELSKNDTKNDHISEEKLKNSSTEQTIVNELQSESNQNISPEDEKKSTLNSDNNNKNNINRDKDSTSENLSESDNTTTSLQATITNSTSTSALPTETNTVEIDSSNAILSASITSGSLNIETPVSEVDTLTDTNSKGIESPKLDTPSEGNTNSKISPEKNHSLNNDSTAVNNLESESDKNNTLLIPNCDNTENNKIIEDSSDLKTVSNSTVSITVDGKTNLTKENNILIVDNEEVMEVDDVVLIDSETPNTSLLVDNSLTEDERLQKNLDEFLNWSKSMLIKLSTKVKVCYKGTSHRYGMIAMQEVKKGEEIFSIPRRVLLNPDSTSIYEKLIDYEDWLEDIGKSLDDSSGWVPLLITLMYEYNSENSPWKQYLQLIPETKNLGHPLFWKLGELEEELQGISLYDDTKQDIGNLEDEYRRYVVPFVYQNKDICKRIEDYSLDLYKRMVAFIMAYSFTEFADTSPSMIPMADILNHHSNNNACLLFGHNNLRMVSSRKIEKGEEIFNTFGKLGNMSLLQMYGYVETPYNQFDTLIVNVQVFIEEMELRAKVALPCLHAMVAYLTKTSIATADACFIFDKNGMRSGPDIINMLKVLHMSESEFESVLRKRAGNRKDSYYHRLLRRLKIAKKTDVSSGVAVIDITEEEEEDDTERQIENIAGEKRKQIECQEIDDNDEDTSPSPTKRSCQQSIVEQGLGNHSNVFSQSKMVPKVEHLNSTVGTSLSSAILIDDSDDETALDNENLESNDNSSINPVNKPENLAVPDTTASTIISSTIETKTEIVVQGNEKIDEIRELEKPESLIQESNINNCDEGKGNDLEFVETNHLEKPECMEIGKSEKNLSDDIQNCEKKETENVIKDSLSLNNVLAKDLSSKTIVNEDNKEADAVKTISDDNSLTTLDVASNEPSLSSIDTKTDISQTNTLTSLIKPVNSGSVNSNPNELVFVNSDDKSKLTIKQTDSGTKSTESEHLLDLVKDNLELNVKVPINKDSSTVEMNSLKTTEKLVDSIKESPNLIVKITAEKNEQLNLTEASDEKLIILEGSNNKEDILEEVNGKLNISKMNKDTLDITEESKLDIEKENMEKKNDNSDIMEESEDKLNSAKESDDKLDITKESEEEDDDDIEIISEDIKCIMTYEALKNQLKPEWNELVKSVLQNINDSMKNDTDQDIDPSKLPRNKFNALQLRKGQRRIINIFQGAIS